MNRTLPLTLFLSLLCLSFTSCDRRGDQSDPEEIAALARSERERERETKRAEREREREANRQRHMEKLRQEDERKKLAEKKRLEEKLRQEEEKKKPVEPELAVESEEDPEVKAPPESPDPVENEISAAEASQLEEEKAMDEAVARRKEALRKVGELHVKLDKLQEIARRENAIRGNMTRKRQAEAAVAKQRQAVKRAELVLQKASEEVKRLRNARLGY